MHALHSIECQYAAAEIFCRQRAGNGIAYPAAHPLGRQAQGASFAAARAPAHGIYYYLDRSISDSPTMFQRDIGIAAQTILLAATEKGLGGCMIGSFEKGALKELLQLPAQIEPMLALAIGKPDETVALTAVGPDGSTDYYRDENDRHHVPKRALNDILL